MKRPDGTSKACRTEGPKGVRRGIAVSFFDGFNDGVNASNLFVAPGVKRWIAGDFCVDGIQDARLEARLRRRGDGRGGRSLARRLIGAAVVAFPFWWGPLFVLHL